jgi:hypothetical protein
VYVLNYGTINQQSFVELTDAINKNKIIILNNIPLVYFIENNIFEVRSVSNNKIKLTSTKVVQTISAGDPNKANLDICIINVTINSDGTASYTYQDTFIHNVGDGTKFLADDGTYKEISLNSSVYLLDYNNINQESFVGLLNAINENKIITLINLPYENFDGVNIFTPTDVSDNKIILSTSKFVDISQTTIYDKSSVSISTIKITINSDGTN